MEEIIKIKKTKFGFLLFEDGKKVARWETSTYGIKKTGKTLSGNYRMFSGRKLVESGVMKDNKKYPYKKYKNNKLIFEFEGVKFPVKNGTARHFRRSGVLKEVVEFKAGKPVKKMQYTFTTAKHLREIRTYDVNNELVAVERFKKDKLVRKIIYGEPELNLISAVKSNTTDGEGSAGQK
jgi:hypothetical protein